MLRMLLALCLLKTSHARTLLRLRELELGWPFGSSNSTDHTEFAPWLRTFPDQCMLWNSSCSGNITEALNEFFNNSGTMYQLVYGAVEYYGQHREGSGIPSDMNSMIVSWLRDPDCRSSFFEWHTENPNQSIWTYTDREENQDVLRTLDWSSVAINTSPFGCCEACELVGGNVDVYFWPMPGANTDCLATVGTTAASDIDQRLLISDARGVGGGWWKSQPNPYYLKSPNSVSLNTVSNSAPLPNLNGINARGYALLSTTDNSPESTTVVIQNGFTFTFPSIYIGFSSLYAVDRCGPIGTYIPYTMLAFAPEELSTIEWPAWDRGSIPLEATKSFNFADLPCPPSNVMIADQYKPAPGSPYRPVLSPPQQIYNLQPGWSNCVITHAFAGIDPPRPLTPAVALVPNPTPASTQSQRAVEAGNEGPTRRPSPAPAQSLKTTGPRSTPRPSSPSAANFDPQTPKNFLDPQESQEAKPFSWLEKLHAPETSKIASESRTSFENAKKTKIQDPSPDGTVIPNLLNFFRFSRVSSSENSDIKTKSTPNHVIPTSLPTHGKNSEASASLRFLSTTLGARPRQNHISSNPSTLPSHRSPIQASEDPQGTSTAEPASWRLQTRLDGRISTADRKSPIHTNRSSDEPSTRVVADPLADIISVLDPAGKPIRGSATETPTHTALKSSPFSSLPNDPEWLPRKTTSPALNAGIPTSATIAVSTSFLEASLGLSTPAASRKVNPNIQTTSSLFDSANWMTPKQPSDTAPDPLLPLSVPSSGPRSSLTDPNTLSNSPNKTSANIEAAFRNQTVFASKVRTPLTVGGPVRASSSPIPTVLAYKSGDGKSISFRLMGALISFASVYFAFFL